MRRLLSCMPRRKLVQDAQTPTRQTITKRRLEKNTGNPKKKLAKTIPVTIFVMLPTAPKAILSYGFGAGYLSFLLQFRSHVVDRGRGNVSSQLLPVGRSELRLLVPLLRRLRKLLHFRHFKPLLRQQIKHTLRIIRCNIVNLRQVLLLQQRISISPASRLEVVANLYLRKFNLAQEFGGITSSILPLLFGEDTAP